MEKIKKFISRRLIVILFFVLAGAVFLISARGEYLQYKEIGEQYVSIFFKNLRTKYIVFFVAFICSYLIIFVSNKIVRRSLKDIFDKEGKNMPRLPNKSISFIVSVIVAVIAESVFTEKFLLFTNVAQAQFGTYDPIFKLDISFYIFQLPFIKSVILFFIVYMVILTLYIAAYYIATINICLDGVDMEDLKKNRFIKQLFTNIFIVAALIAGLMVLGSQEIVTGNMITLNDEARTELVGAGLTEVKIKVIGYRILGVVIFFSLFRTVKYLKKFKVKKIISSMLITPIYLVMLFGVMTGFQYIYANRNEFDKQKEYIKENIKNTRQAYNIAIDEVDVDNSAELDNETILKNTEVLSQITIVDEDTTLANLAEYKDNDGYYTYQTTKIGRYSINGKNRSLYITPREIISGANRTYNNKTYQYTHGYGVVISEATRVDDKTDNILYVQSKYTNEEDKIAIKEPRIYFGMATEDTVVTNVKNKKEFDYPTSTTSYEENEYDGEAGIKANLIDRAVLSLTEQDYKLLFNTSITKDSKILMNRNIRERAKVLLPYLLYDEEPYMVIREDGQLVWVLDAYTVSNSYPFSQKTNIEFEGKYKEINYIRNSVKVIIDAYNGTTTFYITDKTDPIAMLYYNIYPELFADKNVTIPADIQKNIVYPEFLYNIQAKMLERYHNVGTEILYRSDDVWRRDIQVPNSDNKDAIKPYYTYLKTENSEPELGLTISYTKANKQSLNSYLVGTYKDGANKLVLYKLISDTTLPGIQQLNVLIDQDKTISQELNKLNTTGTELIRKTYVVPIENNILYVQPVYQVLLNESKVPTLKKVIVASGTRVAMGDNFVEALTTLMTDSARKIQYENTEDKEQLLKAIIRASNNLKDSAEVQDWELMGSDIKRLQSLIDQLDELMKNDHSPKKEKDM